MNGNIATVIVIGIMFAYDGLKMYFRYRLKMSGKDTTKDIDS